MSTTPSKQASKTPVKLGKISIRKKATKKVVKESCDMLKSAQLAPDITNPRFQQLQRCISAENRKALTTESATQYDYLYPQKDDPSFNVKVAQKKEFYDTRYEAKTREDFDNIEDISDKLCANTEFELEPHQMFVRNFMSFQTPYNSLLLFHGLGTGKTCSAISVCEEMRSYLKQLGITKRIIIVASPAVQENFKIQLFDDRKLKEVDGLWNIKACIGNKFIQEINPMNMRGLSRDRVIRQIKKIINQSYRFLGYSKFSNYIGRVMNEHINPADSEEVKERKRRRALHREFSSRMIVIDEVHNIRVSEDGKVKESSENVLQLVSQTKDIKLLLLSATPMFNSYKEVIWLLNLMNLNDERFPIAESEIFDRKGNFKIDKDGHEVGKELLIQKSTGYISYVRGENPFTFPYRIWPQAAHNPDSLFILEKDNVWTYPTTQINGGTIVEPIRYVDLTISNIGDYQSRAYNFIIQSLKKKHTVLADPSKGVPYTVLDGPLQALNMIYPHTDLEEGSASIVPYLYGGQGLERTMNYDPKTKSDFRYKDLTLSEFGRIFALDEIGKYSGKIKYICEGIKKSRGVVIVYSQFIGGGAVPIALALEEMGITRYGDKVRSLFKEKPTDPIDALTLRPKRQGVPFRGAKYVMITGDRNLTPDVEYDLRAATDPNNVHGEKVKVVIISRAGSEGLDFKNVRQMHILDPWYNLNRQEQIIGRAVRNLSHCALPYEERNVELYLYGTRLKTPTVEAADLYVYRLAERKARKIGQVTRVLKENAVDCLLNRKALNFSQATVDKTVQQQLSSGNTIEYSIGDRENSAICDFTTCAYKCGGEDVQITGDNTNTYNETFIVMNLDKILQRIRVLFRERYIYRKSELISGITAIKKYPRDQIYTALTYLIDDQNEYITDILGRLGHLVNVGDYYMFQPLELSNDHISRFQRVHPIDFKRRSLTFQLPDAVQVTKETKQAAAVSTESLVNQLLDDLRVQLGQLTTPGLIPPEDKENWALAAGWAVNSLVKYNELDKAELVDQAMYHLLDSLQYASKIALLNYVYAKGVHDELDLIIKRFFDLSVIRGGGHIGIVVSDFEQTSGKEPYRILKLKGKKWVRGKETQVAVLTGLGTALLEKFVVKDLKEVNDVIGFMAPFKNTYIVFKTKNINLSSVGRTNKGQRCDRGEGKKVLIERINKTLDPTGDTMKYTLEKSTIKSIYQFAGKDIVQLPAGATGRRSKNEVKINALQLCAEGELLFRYFNKTKKNGLRWFFSSVSASINHIAKTGR